MHTFCKVIRVAAWVSLLNYDRPIEAQQMVPKADYAVYEVSMKARNEPFFLLPKTVPVDGRMNLKIGYQPEASPMKLRNLRPGKDSLWVWEDTLRKPAWRELLLCHNALDLSDSLQFDKTLFIRHKVYDWPSDADSVDRQAMDTIKGTDLQDVIRRREQFKKMQEFARTYHRLSRITYSPDGQRAMFYHAYSCGIRCGSGSLVFLEKINGVWKHYYTHNIWVS